jgi:hypothetical protein
MMQQHQNPGAAMAACAILRALLKELKSNGTITSEQGRQDLRRRPLDAGWLGRGLGLQSCSRGAGRDARDVTLLTDRGLKNGHPT